ncbi:site-specific DNA-methyltransferase [Fundidesulfovibrio butyratiphilus]
MEKLTEQDGMSLNVMDENLKALKNIFPEAFTEDGIDFEVLRQLFGDQVAEGEEKYGLNWFGKKKARQIALTPSTGTLRPCPKESVNWDTTQNMFIEGDNLEVLKILQRSYSGKIKTIYIDPPYNKGKDFLYPDCFKENINTYLNYTGQLDDEGYKFSTNSESSGRFHTNWLNMMYPRLKVAKGLLRSDGIIFISIDDNEVTNLRCLCDEIFGQSNRISEVAVVNNLKGRNDREGIATCHESVLIYKMDGYNSRGLPLSKDKLEEYGEDDGDGKKYQWRDLRKRGGADTRAERPNLYYPIYSDQKTGQVRLESSLQYCNEIYPVKSNGVDGRWRWKKEKVAENVDIICARETRNGTWRVSYKVFLDGDEGERRSTPKSIWMGNRFSTDNATKNLGKLFPELDAKQLTPKPIGMIQEIIQQSMEPGDIILDFFAGSGTTAHAVYQSLVDYDEQFQFILVQLPEKTYDVVKDKEQPREETKKAYEAGFRTIADISKERIRRAISSISDVLENNNADTGFKVFKLDSSNIVAWNPDKTDLEQTLIGHTEHLVPGRSEQDLLYELLLKRGVELTAPIEKKEVSGKTVYSIGFGALFACLDKKIERDQIEDLAQGIIDWHKELDPVSETQVVFRDSAFENDIAKTNITAILEQGGIKHIRSL